MSDSDTVNVVVELQPMSISAPMVKLELEIKQSSEACGICGAEGDTVAPVTEVEDVVKRFAARAASLPLCVSCEELLVALAAAEREYRRLRAILAASLTRSNLSPCIKREVDDNHNGSDSDDEPLARAKQRRVTKRSKKVNNSKQKSRNKDDESWECTECGVGGSEGGAMAEAAHKITCHDLEDCPPMKTEPNDSMDDSQDLSCFEKIFKSEEDMFDDDDSNYFPDELCRQDSKNSKRKKAVPRTKEKKQPKKVYPCSECNAKYTSEARLSRHKDMKHDGSKPPYICEICGAHYKHKRACDIHVALHKGISDWKCEECNKLFPSKGALARHNNIHTGKLNYQCDLCGKSFIHTSSFKMHKLSHSGVKPHSCDVCGLALLTRSHLRRHQRVHSGEKRHACASCGKRFSERYNLLAHAKSHEQTEAGSSRAPAAPAEPRRMFRCHYCSERFERRYMLERHMGTVHNRALERPPPTPRNTMSKLLKQQAAKLPRQTPVPVIPVGSATETKEERSPERLVRGATQIQPVNWAGFSSRPPYITDE